MQGNTKRKWRWSSKSLHAPGQPNKVLVVDQSMSDTHTGAVDRLAANEMPLDGCSMEDARERLGLAARMRGHGSRFLSIVGLQRGSGVCFSLDELPPTKRGQTPAIPSIRQIPQASEMLLWSLPRKP